MNVTTRTRQIENALTEGLRQQGAEIEHIGGSVIAKLVGDDMLPGGFWPCVTVNVSSLAEDMERAMA